MFSATVALAKPPVAVCKPPPASTWKLNKAQLTAKAKTIFVMRVIARIAGREKNAYRIEIVRALKGQRVEQMSMDMVPPKAKMAADHFRFEMGPDCKARGNLVTDHLYIYYPDVIDNLNAIVPVKDMNDPAIDEIDDLIASQKPKGP